MRIIKKAITVVREKNEKRITGGVKPLKVLEVSDLYVLVGTKNEADNFYVLFIIPAIVEFDEKEREVPVNVYVDHDYKGKIESAKVNWAAYGSVEPEFANDYATMLTKAASFSELIDGQDYKDELDKEVD